MSHRRSTRVRSRLALAVAPVVAALLALTGVWTPASAAGTAYYVAETGADTNSGTSALSPFRTLQHAMDLAQPGTTINLLPGRYVEAVATKTAGTAAAPITVKGPEAGKDPAGRDKAVLVSPAGRAFSISHSYWTLDGFTIDGQPRIARSRYPTDPALSDIRSFKDSLQADAVNSKLVYVGAATTSIDIVGTTISNMFLTGSGGECVRFRNRSANSTVVDTVIRWCGMYVSGDDADKYRYHNAEGVYIGTSPKSTDQPMAANDSTNGIVVRNSTIDTFGSECFEVKENAHHNRLENTECRSNDEPASFQGSNVELRGDHNTVLGSRLSGSRSWNLKLASDAPGYDLGGNTAQGSTFSGAATYAIINRQTGSGPFCGNTVTGQVGDPSGGSVGTPTAACTGAPTPTVTAPTPAPGATGVPVATNVTATFSGTVQGVGDTSFTLRAAGASAAVPATVTYDGSTGVATLDPTADLAAGTQYTATLTGGTSAIRDLAGTPLATTTWTFTTAAPPDTTAPTVTARTPAVGATAVAVAGNVTATFSEPVQGVGGTTFTLRAAGASGDVPAAVTYDAGTRVATLDPTADLAPNTQYTATLTGGTTAIRDAAGNALAATTWTFTTAAPPDTTAPTVTARTPAVGATGVAVAGNVTATFSEPVQGVGATTVTLRAGTSSAVAAAVTYDAATRVATLDPTADLAPNTQYTATLTGGSTAIRDAAGNALASTTWTFTTAAAADTTAPTVTARTPAAGATGVVRTGNVTATFSEPVQGVGGTTFTLRAGTSSAVAAAVTYDAGTRVATLDPTADLAPNTQYTATLTGGTTAIRDGAGNALASTTWTFTTAAAADTTAPTVSSRLPASNATDVSRTGNVTITFSEAVQGVGGTTLVLRNTSTGVTIPATVSRDGTTNRWILDPNSTLSARTRFTVTVTGGGSGVRDLAGNPLATTSWSFTTGR